MAADIVLMGATYLSVPAVVLPTSNGTAQFTDVSDTTASASDVASGKYFYTANGTKTQGSATTPSVQTNRSYTVSGSGSATINPSSGYDAMSKVSLTVPSGTATSASSISATGASVSTGTNTLTLSKSVSNTPRITTAGYISSGTAGNSSVSLTANVTTKGATTYTPTTSNQTIASGTYLTGAQTISGDANLVAGNIKKDTTIFGVTGTYEGSGGGGGGSFTGNNLNGTMWFMKNSVDTASLPAKASCYKVLFETGIVNENFPYSTTSTVYWPHYCYSCLCKDTKAGGVKACGYLVQSWNVSSKKFNTTTTSTTTIDIADPGGQLWVFFEGGGVTTTDHTNASLISWMNANGTFLGKTNYV